MSSFKLTRLAKNDLRSIARFTEKRWSKSQRNIYIKEFDDAFHRLAEGPGIGNSCDFIKDGYFKFPQGSHIVFYKKISENQIEIIRILHKKMDVASKFGYS